MWTKINKEKENWDKKIRTDWGWFISGWFTNWFAKPWKEVIKLIEDWTKVTK